jgi:hypothetical protein
MWVDQLPMDAGQIEPRVGDDQSLAPHRDQRALIEPGAGLDRLSDAHEAVPVDKGVQPEPDGPPPTSDPDVVDEGFAEPVGHTDLEGDPWQPWPAHPGRRLDHEGPDRRPIRASGDLGEAGDRGRQGNRIRHRSCPWPGA